MQQPLIYRRTKKLKFTFFYHETEHINFQEFTLHLTLADQFLMALLTITSILAWLFTDSVDLGFIGIASFMFYSTFFVINRLVYNGILDPANSIASAWRMMVLRVFTFFVLILSIIGNMVALFAIYFAAQKKKKGQNVRLVCQMLYCACLIISLNLLKANIEIWTEIKRRSMRRLNDMRRAWDAYYPGRQPGDVLERRGRNGNRIRVPRRPNYNDALAQTIF